MPETVTKTSLHDHLCLFYRTPDEMFGAVLPYLAVGLTRGEQCVYLADETPVAVLKRAMRDFGIDVAGAVRSGNLTILSKKETYLKPGHFDPDWMINLLKEAAAAAAKQGRSIRAAGEMTWALDGVAGSERLSEYESKLNDFFPRHDFIGMCMYNLNRFPSRIISDMIRTHPLVVSESLVCHNHFYRPPRQFTEAARNNIDTDALLRDIRADELMNNARREHNRRLAEKILQG